MGFQEWLALLKAKTGLGNFYLLLFEEKLGGKQAKDQNTSKFCLSNLWKVFMKIKLSVFQYVKNYQDSLVGIKVDTTRYSGYIEAPFQILPNQNIIDASPLGRPLWKLNVLIARNGLNCL